MKCAKQQTAITGPLGVFKGKKYLHSMLQSKMITFYSQTITKSEPRLGVILPNRRWGASIEKCSFVGVAGWGSYVARSAIQSCGAQYEG